MKLSKGKKIIILLMVICLLFGVYNLIWYFTTQVKYSTYSENMDEFIPNRSYVLEGEDGYLYNVKYPDYLSFTGNLGVSNNNNEVSIIIWPSIFGEDKYGLKIDTIDDSYEIIIDREMKAEVSEDDKIIEKYKEEIEKLFQKADERWNIMDVDF